MDTLDERTVDPFGDTWVGLCVNAGKDSNGYVSHSPAYHCFEQTAYTSGIV